MKSIKAILAIVLLVALGLPLTMASPPAAAQQGVDRPNCFPATCDPSDTRMLAVAGAFLSTLKGDDVVFHLTVDEDSFEIGIFDGDTGGDPYCPNPLGDYVIDYVIGNWDICSQQSYYSLWPDAEGDGVDFDSETPLATWYGNDANPTSGPGWEASSATMPNNDWWVATIDASSAPPAPDDKKHYVFRVRNPFPDLPSANHFKLSTNVQAKMEPQAFAVIAEVSTSNDLPIMFPSYPASWTPSTYDGTWDFFFDVTEQTDELVVWDGDFDHGQPGCQDDDCDTDDPDTSGKPDFVEPASSVRDEGVQGEGEPQDDWPVPIFRREPNVTYTLLAPGGAVYHNPNPSGDQEWEAFRLSSENDCVAGVNADHCVVSIPQGRWQVRVNALDAGNEVGLRFPFPLVFPEAPDIGDRVWLDINKNTLQDPGEPDINGVDVKLYRDGGNPVAGDDSDGIFCPEDGDTSSCSPDPKVGTRTTTPLGIAADGRIKNYDFLDQIADNYWVDVVESTLPQNLFLTTNNEPYAGPVGGNLPYPLGLPPDNPPDEDHDLADFGYAPCEECVCVVWGPGEEEIEGAEVVWWLDKAANTVTIRAILDRAFADTAWGRNSMATGWPGKGRKFKQIWTSDNLELTLKDGDGNVVMLFGMDLLAPSTTAPSLWDTAGIDAEDGYLEIGDSTHILDVETSMSVNLNNPANDGCWDTKGSSPEVKVDSEGNYTPVDPGCADWIWDTWYEVTVDLAAFGTAGFGYPKMWGLHSSPSKTGDPQPECEIWECTSDDLCLP